MCLTGRFTAIQKAILQFVESGSGGRRRIFEKNDPPKVFLLIALLLLTCYFSPLVSAQNISPETRINPDTKFTTDTLPSSKDLLFLGFGELTMHILDVSGNVAAFESNNPSLMDGVSTNYRTSLFANGNVNQKFYINGIGILDSRIDDEYINPDPSMFRLKMSIESTEPLWDTWRFSGEGIYDPNRQWEYENLDMRLLTQPQIPARAELMARLESDKYGYVEGGSLRPSFTNAKFSLYQRSLFGIYSNLQAKPVGVEAVAGKLEGKSYREGDVVGIRADGTSGPFDLANAPVTRGSEEVKIEARDRFNQTTVKSSRVLIRDQDYTIDYDRGRILLYQPVASETIATDPVYIVITYDYQRLENDEILGSRLKLMPDESAEVSASYLHRYIDVRATGGGVDEPENLLAGDATFSMEDYGSGYMEIAGAENPDSDDTYAALRAGLTINAINDLDLKADYQRIEDKFRSFGNSDLEPTKNQQRLHLTSNYHLDEKRQLLASFQNIRGLEANGQHNPYPGKRDEKIYTLGYREKSSTALGFGLNLEQRDIENLDDPLNEDSRQRRLIADLGGE
jgi:hypothetical protein